MDTKRIRLSDHYPMSLSDHSRRLVPLPTKDMRITNGKERFRRNHEILSKHGRTLLRVPIPRTQGPDREDSVMSCNALYRETNVFSNEDLMVDIFDSRFIDGVETMMDIGCGDGHQTVQFVEASPSLRMMYALDLLPRSLAGTDRTARDKGVRNRVQLLHQDYNDGINVPDGSLRMMYALDLLPRSLAGTDRTARDKGVRNRVQLLHQDYNDGINVPDGVKMDLVYSCYALHGIDPAHPSDKFAMVRNIMSKGGLFVGRVAGSDGLVSTLIDLSSEILVSHGRHDRLVMDPRRWHPSETTLGSALEESGFVDVVVMVIASDDGEDAALITEDDVEWFFDECLGDVALMNGMTSEEVDLVRGGLMDAAVGSWAVNGTATFFALNPA